SKELCGGTHAAGTGQIGIFKILREASPGAGMRRIEAVTLKGVLDRYNALENMVSELVKIDNVTESGVVKRIDDLMKRSRALEKEIEKLKKESRSSGTDSLMSGMVEVNGIKIIPHIFNGMAAEEMREISDSIRSKEQNAVVLLGSGNQDSALLLFAATNGAVKKGIDCGRIIKEASSLIGGGGGGRKDMAQAGGKSAEGLEGAIARAVEIARGLLNK